MKPSMFQTLDNREVGILKFNILSDQTNLDRLDRRIYLRDETFPLRKIHIAFNPKNFTRDSVEAFFMQDQWKFINIARVSSVDDCFRIDVTHVRDLALQTTAERLFAATHNDIWLNTTRTKLCNAVLSGLCLLLTTWPDKRHQSDMQVTHIVAACFVTKLTDCLQEGQNLNVAHSAAHFGDHNIGVIGSNTANTALDLVGDVRDNLHGLSEVVATSFSGKNCLVDGSSRSV